MENLVTFRDLAVWLDLGRDYTWQASIEEEGGKWVSKRSVFGIILTSIDAYMQQLDVSSPLLLALFFLNALLS